MNAHHAIGLYRVNRLHELFAFDGTGWVSLSRDELPSNATLLGSDTFFTYYVDVF